MTPPSAPDPIAAATALLVEMREHEYQELVRRVQLRRASPPRVDPRVHMVSLTDFSAGPGPARPIALDDEAAEIRATLDAPSPDYAAVLRTLAIQTLQELAMRLLLEGSSEAYARAVSDLALAVALTTRDDTQI